MNILVHLPQTAFLQIETWDWPGVLVSDPTVAEVLVIDPNVTLYEEQLDFYPELRVIVTASTGTNHIDLAECASRNIKVLSLLDDREGLDTIKASSEFTFLLLLATLKNLKAALTKAIAIQCAMMVGGAQQELEMTAEHTKTRIQFERPIGSF